MCLLKKNMQIFKFLREIITDVVFLDMSKMCFILFSFFSWKIVLDVFVSPDLNSNEFCWKTEEEVKESRKGPDTFRRKLMGAKKLNVDCMKYHYKIIIMYIINI